MLLHAVARLVERADVAPGEERAALAREHERAQAVLVLGPAARLEQQVRGLGVDRVQAVGPVEADGRDRPVALEQHRVGHAPISSSRRSLRDSFPTAVLGSSSRISSCRGSSIGDSRPRRCSWSSSSSSVWPGFSTT